MVQFKTKFTPGTITLTYYLQWISSKSTTPMKLLCNFPGKVSEEPIYEEGKLFKHQELFNKPHTDTSGYCGKSSCVLQNAGSWQNDKFTFLYTDWHPDTPLDMWCANHCVFRPQFFFSKFNLKIYKSSFFFALGTLEAPQNCFRNHEFCKFWTSLYISI